MSLGYEGRADLLRIVVLASTIVAWVPAHAQETGQGIALANSGALVMHCLPAYRGKEIDEETFEANAQTIFDQAENRLHVQKSILNWIIA